MNFGHLSKIHTNIFDTYLKFLYSQKHEKIFKITHFRRYKNQNGFCFRPKTSGKNIDLYYFRDADKREVDFIITENQKPIQAIECKIKSREISPSLKYFKSKFPKTKCLQISLECEKEYLSKEGIKNLSWHSLLKTLV